VTETEFGLKLLPIDYCVIFPAQLRYVVDSLGLSVCTAVANVLYVLYNYHYTHSSDNAPFLYFTCP